MMHHTVAITRSDSSQLESSYSACQGWLGYVTIQAATTTVQARTHWDSNTWRDCRCSKNLWKWVSSCSCLLCVLRGRLSSQTKCASKLINSTQYPKIRPVLRAPCRWQCMHPMRGCHWTSTLYGLSKHNHFNSWGHCTVLESNTTSYMDCCSQTTCKTVDTAAVCFPLQNPP